MGFANGAEVHSGFAACHHQRRRAEGVETVAFFKVGKFIFINIGGCYLCRGNDFVLEVDLWQVDDKLFRAGG